MAAQGSNLEARHAAISQSQDVILARALAVTGGVAAAEADEAYAIRRLKYSPHVRRLGRMRPCSADWRRTLRVVRIHEDRTSRPLLSETVELIGGPGAHAQGATGENWAVAILDTGARRSNKFLSGKVVAAACYSTYASQPSHKYLSRLCDIVDSHRFC